jgi:hypothetical protein
MVPSRTPPGSPPDDPPIHERHQASAYGAGAALHQPHDGDAVPGVIVVVVMMPCREVHRRVRRVVVVLVGVRGRRRRMRVQVGVVPVSLRGVEM